MTERYVLDSTPLSLLCLEGRRQPRVQEPRAWLRIQMARRAAIYVSEIVDYEVRRELLRAGKAASVRRLDDLLGQLRYLPITTTHMRRAAAMWAQLRNQGQPTASPEALDADVILAAQAEAIGAVVITENVGHLARLVAARTWREL